MVCPIIVHTKQVLLSIESSVPWGTAVLVRYLDEINTSATHAGLAHDLTGTAS